MLKGTATIFTKRTSGPEIVTHGENGLLVDPYDKNDIADKILLLLHDHPYNSYISVNGQKHVKLYFYIRKIANKHIEYYYTLLNKKEINPAMCLKGG